MNRNPTLLYKTLVVVVIILIICTIVLPTTGMMINKKFNPEKQHITFEEISKPTYQNPYADEWPQFKYNAQGTGYVNTTGPEFYNKLWTFTFGTWEAFSTPIIAYGKVYMSSDNEVFYCLDAYNGDIIWECSLPGGESSAPAIYEDKVYQTAVYNYTYCWDAITGELLWKHDEGYGGSSNPVPYDGKLYVYKLEDNTKGRLYCLDADNGTELWDYHFGIVFCHSSPAIYEGKIYIGSGWNDTLYCLDVDNGEIIWSKNISGRADSSPAIVNDRIYTLGGNRLWCLNSENGSEIWSYEFAGDYYWESPSVANGKVYICLNGVRCFNAESGTIVWEKPGGATDCLFPAVCQGKLYVTNRSTGKVYCLDSDNGSKLWEYQICNPGNYLGPPSIGYDKLFVAKADIPPKLYCFGLINTSNNPPQTPTINGSNDGITGKKINYTFFTSDPEGDDICYKINWGDGGIYWYGPFPSGEHNIISYIWDSGGNYSIWAQARDVNLNFSDWSDPFDVSITPCPPSPPFNPCPYNGRIDVDVNDDISWECDYPDDPIYFDVYFEAEDPTPDILVSNNQSDKFYDPGHMIHSTQYYWQIVVWNILGESSVGPVWSFTTENNVPPYPPNDPEPEDDAIDVDINAWLSWEGGDPDGDPVTYDVYFGDSYPPILVVNNQSNTTYDPGTLDYETEYHWRIVSWDYLGLNMGGNYWNFTTGNFPNNPPYKPSNPFPEDGAIDVDIIVNLSWIGGDPDPGDTVVYDVFFEAWNSKPEVKIADDISETWFNPGLLKNGTIYYWKIKAVDNHYAVKNSPIWSFSTVNDPPTMPMVDGPKCGNTGEVLSFSFVSDDPEDNDLFYFVDWSDGSNSSWLGPYGSGETVFVSHIFDVDGEYEIMALARDIIGDDSNWSIPFYIKIGNHMGPGAPDIDGPQKGGAGANLVFSFVAVDPDGDDIIYEISWGDGNGQQVGPVSSGEKIFVNHSWLDDGDYVIRSRCKDVFCSPFSDWNEHEITIPRNRIAFIHLLHWLSELFPLLERLLSFLLL